MAREFKEVSQHNALVTTGHIFYTLSDARAYCKAHKLDESHIQYNAGEESEKRIKKIALWQSAVLEEMLEEISVQYNKTLDRYKREINFLKTCHPLDKDYIQIQIERYQGQLFGLEKAEISIRKRKAELERIYYRRVN